MLAPKGAQQRQCFSSPAANDSFVPNAFELIRSNPYLLIFKKWYPIPVSIKEICVDNADDSRLTNDLLILLGEEPEEAGKLHAA